MFDIGFTEIVVIAVVALVVLGPEKLPKTARTLGHLFGRLQRYVNEVKNDIRREIDLDELNKLKQNVQNAARDFESSMASATKAVESGVRGVEAELNAAGGAIAEPVAEPSTPPPPPPPIAAPAPSSAEAPRQASLPGFDRG